MKKILLLLILVVSSTVAFSQIHVTSTITEMYTYNTRTEDWDLYQKNSDVKITIVLEEDFITFLAKKPTMYKIYKSSAQEIKTKSLEGMRYRAIDLRAEVECTIDVLRLDNGGYLVSVIPKDRSYNLRYWVPEE